MCSERGMCNHTIGQCQCLPGFFGVDCNPGEACVIATQPDGSGGPVLCLPHTQRPENCPGTDAFGTACGGRGVCNKTASVADASNFSTPSCICAPGFIGAGCEKEKCPNDCSGSGKGVCGEEGCKCRPGYAGNDCGRAGCPEDCNGNGFCDTASYTCQCNMNFTGASCSIRACPSNCHSHGRCINGTCSCSKWWTGPECKTPSCPADSEGNPCYHNGVCMLGGKPMRQWTWSAAKK